MQLTRYQKATSSPPGPERHSIRRAAVVRSKEERIRAVTPCLPASGLQHPLRHLGPEQRTYVLDPVGDHRDRGAREEESHRDVVQREHQRA